MPPSATAEPETWLKDYGDMLYRYALLRVRSQDTAEDLVQDTLLAGLQGFQNFTGQSTVQTWLVGILKHKIIDYFRKNRHETSSLSESDMGDDLLAYQFDEEGNWQVSLVEWSTPDQALDNEQFWRVFNDCLSRLPKKMADLFVLRTLENLSSEECCKVLELNSTNQLWVTLSRTRMKLRQCLDTRWFDKE